MMCWFRPRIDSGRPGLVALLPCNSENAGSSHFGRGRTRPRNVWQHRAAAAVLFVTVGAQVHAAPSNFNTVLFGAAYYDEYSPYERLDRDVAMMSAAGITVVRIGESTWGTVEPQEGVFDFTHIDRVLRAMEKAHIKVIVGTPTYAIPTWLARKYPAVLVTQMGVQAQYGTRQNMDLANPDYRRAAERIIRAMVAHVRSSPAVIGYQLDNETKPYGNTGPYVQAGFRAAMGARWPNLEAMNRAWGLDYWSNRINAWEDFPNVEGAANASVAGAFAEYQRGLVTEFLGWQADIVRSLKRPDQFLTHNFDLQGGGIQSQVDHFGAARSLDIAGIDIYHGSQDQLGGVEIAFGNDLARSMRGGQNHLVLETQAQGIPEWLPYPGQLRLQTFSHFASGANMVEYWHWATQTNGFETHFRGLLDQDYAPNPTYREAATIGADLKRIGPEIVNLRKNNRVALYFSNRALTAFETFRFGWASKATYNDLLRPYYDALFNINVETDLVDPSVTDLSKYRLIVVPSLYAASDAELMRLNAFARNGGHVVYGFRSGFSDENVKVRTTPQPGGIAEAAGASYSQFTMPVNVALVGNPFHVSPGDNQARLAIELLTPTKATVLARYDHPVWGKYAAITRNPYGRGEVTYVGFMPSGAVLEALLGDAAARARVTGPAQAAHWPVIVRSGINGRGRTLHYLLNYSSKPQSFDYRFAGGHDLLSGEGVAPGKVALLPWGVRIVAED